MAVPYTAERRQPRGIQGRTPFAAPQEQRGQRMLASR
jgi:hypothetical protein